MLKVTSNNKRPFHLVEHDLSPSKSALFEHSPKRCRTEQAAAAAQSLNSFDINSSDINEQNFEPTEAHLATLCTELWPRRTFPVSGLFLASVLPQPRAGPSSASDLFNYLHFIIYLILALVVCSRVFRLAC